MTGSVRRAPKTFRGSESEQASIRALKNWLLSAPPDNALDDPIVRQRIAAAIAGISSSRSSGGDRR